MQTKGNYTVDLLKHTAYMYVVLTHCFRKNRAFCFVWYITLVLILL